MSLRFAAALVAFCAVTFLAPVSARAVDPVDKSLLTPPPTGAWSSFRLTGNDGAGPKQIYVAAVRREQWEGKPHLWLELTSVGENGDSLSVMGLYPADGELGLVAKKVVLKTDRGTAQEVPANLVRVGSMLASKFGLGIDFEELAASIRQNLDRGVTATPGALERLEAGGIAVRARRLLVRDSRGREGTVWLSPQIPLFSFVRAEYEGSVLELTGFGSGGAVSRIGNDYQPFDLGEIMKRMLGK